MLDFLSGWHNYSKMCLALVSYTPLQFSAKGIPKHLGTVLLCSDDSCGFNASCFFSTGKDIHFCPAQSLSPSHQNVHSTIKSETALTCCYNISWMWKVYCDLMWNMGKGVIWLPLDVFSHGHSKSHFLALNTIAKAFINCFSFYYLFICC